MWLNMCSTEWDIEPSKIIASLTDNGSNMVAAFRKKVEANVCGQEGEDEEEEEEVAEEDSEAAVDKTLDFDCQALCFIEFLTTVHSTVSAPFQ